MHAKKLHSSPLPKIIFLCARRCALGIFLCSAVAIPSARPAIHAQSSREGANNDAASESSHLAAAIDAGQIVFNQRCEVCHFSDSAAQKIGPGLKGLFARARFADGGKVSEASVAARITKGGKDMPAYEGVLKAGQLQALIAYLKTR